MLGLGVVHRMVGSGSAGSSTPALPSGSELVDDSLADGELVDDNLADYALVDD
jgi:hypothetical protein